MATKYAKARDVAGQWRSEFRKVRRENRALRLEVLAMREVMRRMVTGIEHLAEIARLWEPDHSTGAERRGWVLAQDAKDDAERLLAAQDERLLSATFNAGRATPPRPEGGA